MLKGLAKQHKAMFDRMVDEAGVTVTVRQPPIATASTSPADKVLGKRPDAAPEAYGEATTAVALWSTGYSGNDALGTYAIPAQIAALGRTDGLDVILRLKLADYLVDPENRHGATLFDTAKAVTYETVTYKVRATDRSGLPPLGPYILWVALQKE